MSEERHRDRAGAERPDTTRPEDLPTLEQALPGATNGNGEVGVDWRATAIGTSQPPVRIIGSERRWRAGFRVDR